METPMSVETDQPAPDFSMPTDGGGHVSLADLRGKTVVLYFYPKDDTSGCTKEAIAFKEALADFEAADAVIVGVSKDPVTKHDKFKAKHDLPFTLASDADSDVCERYGVWKEKSMYGKTYMGIERTTVLIDGAGVVRQVWPKVKVAGHAEAVLEAVRALG
jgi:peroxiredoxin